MSAEGFFTRNDEAYLPGDNTRGPWDLNSLHGRFVVGLFASVIEERHGADDFMPARLTVDMFRLPDRSPIEVTTRAIRDGQRIKAGTDLFVARALALDVDLELHDHPTGQHAFDTRDDNARSRGIIAAALDFFARRLGLVRDRRP